MRSHDPIVSVNLIKSTKSDWFRLVNVYPYLRNGLDGLFTAMDVTIRNETTRWQLTRINAIESIPEPYTIPSLLFDRMQDLSYIHCFRPLDSNCWPLTELLGSVKIIKTTENSRSDWNRFERFFGITPHRMVDTRTQNPMLLSQRRDGKRHPDTVRAKCRTLPVIRGGAIGDAIAGRLALNAGVNSAVQYGIDHPGPPQRTTASGYDEDASDDEEDMYDNTPAFQPKRTSEVDRS